MEEIFKRFESPTTADGTLIIIQSGSLENHDIKLYNIDDVIDLLHGQYETITRLEDENKELRLDNDIKFWKQQFSQQYNNAQLILHELSLAINDGYEVSDRFKEYLNDLKERNKEVEAKYKRLFELTEKRYRKVLGLIEDNEGDGDGLLDLTGIEDRLNEQDMHIFLLKCVIQTIDVELQEKGMTKERFEEIKNYYYQKFKGDLE